MTLLATNLRDKLSIVIVMERVNSLFAVSQEIFHGIVSTGGNADQIPSSPDFHTHQDHIDVQLSV